jgi:hypothetical protein
MEVAVSEMKAGFVLLSKEFAEGAAAEVVAAAGSNLM